MNYKAFRCLLNRPAMIRLIDPADVWGSIETATELRTWPYEDAAEDGVQVIPVSGILVNRSGYDRIRDWTSAAMRNEKVRGILLRMNSYGGEVDGVFDTADVIRETAKVKPVWASVDDNAFSAAYLLASQVDRIYTTRTGGVGSVGVIAVHYDFSRWLEREGIKPTVITFGARKADYSPELPLSPEAEAKLRSEVNRLGMQFVAYVAQGRRLTESAILATEADWYPGQDGIRLGLADRLGTFEQALREFKAELDGRTSVSFSSSPSEITGKENSVMNSGTTAEPKAAETPETKSPPNQPAPQANADSSVGRTVERERIRAILGCEEAKGRESLARTIALETDSEPEQARKLLAAAPVESRNSFAEAMARVKNPEVGADADNPENEAAESGGFSFWPAKSRRRANTCLRVFLPPLSTWTVC
jgi:signal peptide peptidase SppA